MFFVRLLLCAAVALGAAGVRAADPPSGGRPVYLLGAMSDLDRTIALTGLAASGRADPVLLTPTGDPDGVRRFLHAYQPERIIPIGSRVLGSAGLAGQIEVPVAAPWMMRKPGALELLGKLFAATRRVVVCPPEPAGLLLQAACLAGVLEAPLFVVRGAPGEAAALQRQAAAWGCRDVWAVGPVQEICDELVNIRVHHLADETAVAARHRRELSRKGPIQNLVLANPSDCRLGLGQMSVLAPWLAIQKRAALLLTNETGSDAAAVVQRALHEPALRDADALLILADLRAVPLAQRPNPAAGKDTVIEMEPLTPPSVEPCTLAVGRLFHADPAVVALQVARQRLLVEAPTSRSRRALVVSNPTGGLPLLELFSRSTAAELTNCGYRMTALYHHEVSPDELRRLLPQQDVFLWEGHHNTLIKDWGFADWTEPLPPSFVFLQSCLALTPEKAHPLLERGAVAVVGSSSRIYSATGGAFALAYFNALLYEGQSLGGALRQAKNFLLAYALLKEKRLGSGAPLIGANQRSAWAFTLWGDPTLCLPRPPGDGPALAPVRHRVEGKTIVVSLPEQLHEPVATADFRGSREFRVQARPNARLGGLIMTDQDHFACNLQPLIYAEVTLPAVRPGQTPRLTSKLPQDRWVFTWDARRRAGHLLAVPRPGDAGELRFSVTTMVTEPGLTAP